MYEERHASLLIQAEAAYREVISDPRRGRQAAIAVAHDARAHGAHEALVVALRAAGWAARELYDHDAARAYLNEAARVARRTGLRRRLCEALIVRSATFLELGWAGRARTDLHRARALADGDASVRADVAIAEALVEDTTGNVDAAVVAYRRALVELGDDRPDQRVKALNNLALLIGRLGRYDEAEALLTEAYALAMTFSEMFAGFVTESQAIVAIAAGRPVVALRRYDEAERRLTAAQAQLADLYLGKANALFTLRLLDEAATAAARAVAHVDGVAGGSLMLAEALLPKARIALARGEHGEARAAAVRAEDLFRRQRRGGWRAGASLLRLAAEVASGATAGGTLGSLRRLERSMVAIGNQMGTVEAAHLYGDVAAARGNDAAAIEAFDRAARAARRGTVLLRLRGYHAAARSAEIMGDRPRTGQVCRRGLDELASYQSTFASVELRTRAAGHGRALAEIGLRSALRSGRSEQIWNWLERGHATAFVRGRSQSDDRLQRLLAERRVDERELQELPPDAAAERREVLRRIHDVERRIRNVSWTRTGGRDELTAPSVRALRALRAGLGDRVLLQCGMIDGVVHAVAVTERGYRSRSLGAVADVTVAGRHLAFALRRLAEPRSASGRRAATASARESLERLRELLVAPFHDLVADSGEVIVAAQGQLMAIPWGVLGPLADRPLRVTPSATAWLLSSEQRPASDRVVVIGGPGIAHARAEVDSVARVHGHAEVLVDPAASCAVVRKAASGARLVHVASHGQLRADSPTFSSLLLSDGSLTVHDLDEMEQPAHHWILAACDLGRPGTLVGPELEGVVATVLAGGAGAVVAAIVSVPDLSTRHMMTELHRCLAEGRTPAEALWTARTAIGTDDPQGMVASVAFSCYGGG
jgi:tetratricopeptide (TPR) repeat protein